MRSEFETVSEAIEAQNSIMIGLCQLDIAAPERLTIWLMNIIDLSAAQLRKAANIKEKITSLQKELGGILGTTDPVGDGAVPKRRRRKMSAAAKARMAVAARARWARIKAGKK
jgi:adenosyl cobinamide kinase/adenosyl cobinamide phosphate guanylyltransferase